MKNTKDAPDMFARYGVFLKGGESGTTPKTSSTPSSTTSTSTPPPPDFKKYPITGTKKGDSLAMNKKTKELLEYFEGQGAEIYDYGQDFSGSELVKKYNSRFNDDEQTYEYELQPDLSEFTNRGFSTYSHVVGKSFPSELI